ncbi:Dyp-type peroxidase [Lentzea sp. NPDC051213]|uniref:Dyp-type peroxidase n=1 Tax=Lentzea sp. NPDC051213 TaxID=3364126 RepID=UPI0037B550E2
MIPVEPVLPVDDVQGDVLAGFRKPHQTFLFLKTVDAAAAKRSLGDLVPLISSLRDVAAFNAAFRSARSRRGEAAGLVATWVGIAFTATGLTRLTNLNDVGRFADRSFKLGLARRSAFLGDPVVATDDGHPSGWLFGGTTTLVDAVVLVASESPDALATREAECAALLAPGYEIVWRERCDAIADRPGHEHFGFRDGISHPGVRGRLDETTFLTPREIEIDESDPVTLLFARRGQPLVWPGQFVLGLPRQRASATDPAPLPPLPVFPHWARHGSLVVIRRLRQDVDTLRRFLEESAGELAVRPGFAGITPDRLAALLVGRWPSGAPLVRSPRADDELLGAARGPANAFGYLNARPPLPVVPGVSPDDFPPALPDPGGALCPHGGHIRKMNPRDQPGASDSLTHLILRRGIPFDHGPGDRGLMFVCYQASLRQGFEFLSTIWANTRSQPLAEPGGMDLLIGRRGSSLSGRTRSLVLVGSNGERATLTTTLDWVVPTGGGYFFAPSLTALRDVLSR